jgi:hypothetical protein
VRKIKQRESRKVLQEEAESRIQIEAKKNKSEVQSDTAKQRAKYSRQIRTANQNRGDEG